ncbi:hypothetical protein KAR48_14835 [bacterium]|nr:hypothetical protein [bacterium]
MYLEEFLCYNLHKMCPIVDSQEVSMGFSINPSTALRLIDDFVKLGILVEITGYKRNRVFAFENYLQLFA